MADLPADALLFLMKSQGAVQVSPEADHDRLLAHAKLDAKWIVNVAAYLQSLFDNTPCRIEVALLAQA
jgi:hypothetical protein